MLRTLVLSQNLFYPTFAGMDLRNLQNIYGLAEIGEVGVFGLHSNDLRAASPPSINLAFWRVSSDPALTFPWPEKKLAGRAWLLDPTGHPADLYYSAGAAAELEAILTDFRPNVAVLEGLWLHRYIDIFRRHSCRIILDLHSVEAAKFSEMGEASEGTDLRAKLFRDVLPKRIDIIERRAVHAVNQVWVCSAEDAGLIGQLYPGGAPVHVVPNCVDIDKYQSVRERALPLPRSMLSDEPSVLFPAVFRWQPNGAAAALLIEKVFPVLEKEFPRCQLLLVGGAPTEAMLAAAAHEPRIIVSGLVADTLPFFSSASVMAAPVFHSGGTLYKLIEAFAGKVPVISTRRAAAGLAVQDHMHLLFAESAEEFVSAIKRIWRDESLAQRLANNALALVREQYSLAHSSACIRHAVSSLG